jgi:hypothetical protein
LDILMSIAGLRAKKVSSSTCLARLAGRAFSHRADFRILACHCPRTAICGWGAAATNHETADLEKVRLIDTLRHSTLRMQAQSEELEKLGKQPETPAPAASNKKRQPDALEMVGAKSVALIARGG